MNTLLKFLIFTSAMVSANIINLGEQSPQRQQMNSGSAGASVRDRKLVFAPYVSQTEYAANSVGEENSAPQGPTNNIPGPFQDAPLPSFGLGGMMPQSLGLTNTPYNYMYGSAMMHPLNPMNAMNPMNGAAAMGMNMMGAAPANVQGLYNSAAAPGFGNMGQMEEMGDELVNPTFDRSRQLANWGDLPRAQVRVGSYCQNVSKQAVEIANAIMKRQNRIIFKELMNYLLKSKYLIGMTEVKLTRVVRKKIYALMNEYSNINETNVQFIPVKENTIIKKEIVYQNADTASTTTESAPAARRNLKAKNSRK